MRACSMRSWFRPATAVGARWIDPNLRRTCITASAPPVRDRAGARKCRPTRKRRAASAVTSTRTTLTAGARVMPPASWWRAVAVLERAAECRLRCVADAPRDERDRLGGAAEQVGGGVQAYMREIGGRA